MKPKKNTMVLQPNRKQTKQKQNMTQQTPIARLESTRLQKIHEQKMTQRTPIARIESTQGLSGSYQKNLKNTHTHRLFACGNRSLSLSLFLSLSPPPPPHHHHHPPHPPPTSLSSVLFSLSSLLLILFFLCRFPPFSRPPASILRFFFLSPSLYIALSISHTLSLSLTSLSVLVVSRCHPHSSSLSGRGAIKTILANLFGSVAKPDSLAPLPEIQHRAPDHERQQKTALPTKKCGPENQKNKHASHF